MNQNQRIAVGFLLSPALVPAVHVVTLGKPPVFLSVAALSYAMAFALGVPGFLLMRSRGWLRWWQALAASFVLGAVPFVLFAVAGEGLSALRFGLLLALLGGAYAMLVGGAFWFISLRAHER